MMIGLNGRKVDLKVLLPVSFQPSWNSFLNCENALCLLDILITFHKAVYKSYLKITILGVQQSRDDDFSLFFQKVMETYDLTDEDVKFEVMNLEEFYLNKPLFDVQIENNSAKLVKSESQSFADFPEYIGKTTNTSAREDILFNIQWKSVLDYAKANGFASVLFTNNMSSLAIKIMSSIVKGRGAEVAQILQDENDEDRILYPVRDILQSEVTEYNKLLGLNLLLPQKYFDELKTEVVNLRTATMDELLSDYFINLEKNGYQIMVSTVVSTVMKLDNSKKVTEKCEVCGFKMAANPTKWMNDITVGDVQVDSSDKVCYGCMASFAKSNTPWPAEKQAILDEYILD